MSSTERTQVGTQQGEASAQQLFITPDEALGVVMAYHRLQRVEKMLDMPLLQGEMGASLRTVIARAGLSALVA